MTSPNTNLDTTARSAPIALARMASPAEWQPKATEAAALMKALAHPDRLLLLCQLVEGERSVSELGEAAGLGQPSLSQQLAVLRGERLVVTRRDGKAIYYRIDSPAALALLQTLYRLYCSEPLPGEPDAGPTRNPTRRTARL